MGNVVEIKKDPTICKECRHYLHQIQNVAAPEVWYNHFCGAEPVRRELSVDPVTGGKGYKAINSLGEEYLADTPHPYCRNVNKGACPHYHPKQTTK